MSFVCGQKFSVLPALSVDSVIALDIFEGAVNKEKFIGFLREQVAPKLTPFPGPRSAVVIDNCAIHHDEDVRHIIEGLCGMCSVK
ncbi:hypothetical protein DEU56DRAFT_726321 [Suillus clintonianus]|uniref:uncharacterized protein n=1 Tax=Suillus clintonianus TaxID=1904413 RepID=UPI001B864E77|nr:uncharacterized protein DEU56DRAFT_726321 [Suillus clintonianus]KAG2153840.1 hypothetical protein DEU56DRAFT_726321 [Suillus clintonianus]